MGVENDACFSACRLKRHCTPSPMRRVSRWEHEGVVDAILRRHAQMIYSELSAAQSWTKTDQTSVDPPAAWL